MNTYFRQGFEKTSTPKWVKLFQQGKLSTKSLRRAATKLKLNPREIEPIGSGVESVVHKVTHPKAGIAVQKTFNTKSPFYSKGVLEDKIKLLEEHKKNRLFAKYLGRKSGKPVIYQEYVKPGKVPKHLKRKIGQRTRRSADKIKDPMRFGDLHEGNIVQGRSGKKIVDFLPVGGKNFKKLPMTKHYARITKIQEDIMKAPSERKRTALYNKNKDLIEKLNNKGTSFSRRVEHTLSENKSSPNAVMRRAHGQ